jgi:hypothetical protein
MPKDKIIIALLRRRVGNGGAAGGGGGEADGQGVQLEGGDMKPPNNSVANYIFQDFSSGFLSLSKKNDPC